MNSPTIVTIDRQLLQSEDSEKIKSVFEKGFRDTGFAYVSNHGISEKNIDRILRLSDQFFNLPQEEKEKIHMSRSGLAWRGYFPVGGELTSGIPDQKEGIYFGHNHPSDHEGVKNNWPLHGQNLWPQGDEFSEFPNLIDNYLKDMGALALDLMAGFALSLGLPRSYFLDRFQEPTTLFRIFNYPKHIWSEEDEQWGVREHTDMGFLTILKQDNSGGLQAQKRDKTWVDIPPKEGTFVINIGDMLEFWTHGYYRATPHRVKNQGSGDRLSLPYFFDPNWKSSLEPIPLKELKVIPPSEEQKRWDGLDLLNLPYNMTYGEFVWNKVKDVFPGLASTKG